MINKHQPSQPASGRDETKTGGQAQFGALLMTDAGSQRSGPPSLFRGLTESEIAQVLGSGKRRVLYRGAQLAIDLTHSQIWDASSVAALDSIQTKYREHGATVTFTGLDQRSSSFHERLTG